MAICSYNDGKSFNPFAKMLLDYLQLYAPLAVKKCPWTGGAVGVFNLSLDNSKIISLVPSGSYRYFELIHVTFS